MRPYKGVIFSIYRVWIESPKNPIPLLHLCPKKLNHDFEITFGRFFYDFITRATRSRVP